MTILYDIYRDDLSLLEAKNVSEEFITTMETINWEIVRCLLDIEEHINAEEEVNPDAYILVHLKKDPVVTEASGYSDDLTKSIFSCFVEHSDKFKLMAASLISINNFRDN